MQRPLPTWNTAMKKAPACGRGFVVLDQKGSLGLAHVDSAWATLGVLYFIGNCVTFVELLPCP